MSRAFYAWAAATAVAIPLLAGGMYLEVADPATDAEAQARHAIVVAQIAACHSPEKTTVKATAEGMANGVRTSIPLTVQALSAASRYAVLSAPPQHGTWVVKITATNPDYRGYVTGIMVQLTGSKAHFNNAKKFGHDPTSAEISAMMVTGSAPTLTSSN